MEPVTRGRPKELLPIRGKPLLEWAADEAKSVRCREIIVVTAPGKLVLDNFCREKGLNTVVQPRMLGLAHAIVSAGLVKEPMLVLLPDAYFYPQSPVLRLTQAFQRPYSGVVAVERQRQPGSKEFGMVETNESSLAIDKILEKPDASQSQSTLAVAARYVLGPDVLEFMRDYVRSQANDRKDEIGITEVLNGAISNGLAISYLETNSQEKRFDCGTPDGYRSAMSVLGA